MSTYHTAWIEVNTSAIRHNYRQIKQLVGPGVSVMAVIKTNGYGHGLELAAQALADEADWFGVSTPEEGLRLRAAGVTTPALVFQPLSADNLRPLSEANLTASVDSKNGLRAMHDAVAAGEPLPAVHLKVDTGMSRYGIPWDAASTFYRELADVPGIRLSGVYTHLATATDRDAAAARAQLQRFSDLLSAIPTDGIFAHALNSAGLIRFPNARCRMVRSGTLLFGQYPPNVPHALDLQPTWTFKTRIVSLRKIPAGTSVGYGAEWTARRTTRIATIPVGYVDGLTLLPMSVWRRQGALKLLVKRITGRDRVIVQTPHGPAPVIGRIASQSAMLDVTGLPGVSVGDVVEIPSRRLLVGEHIARTAIEA